MVDSGSKYQILFLIKYTHKHTHTHTHTHTQIWGKCGIEDIYQEIKTQDK
jgi:hypothetical protein